MAGVDVSKYSGAFGFIDVKQGDYYSPYVVWASKYGITSGTGSRKFSPGEYVNREQMAAFFVRCFENFGVNCDTGASITTTPADIDSVSPWARDAVLKLWRMGLLNGDGTNFDPAGNAIRAQAAAICCRTDKEVETWYDPAFAEGTKVSANTRGSGPMTLYARWTAA